MPYCDRCDGRYFKSWTAYHRHVANSSRHNVCDDCDRDFPSWFELKEHWVESPNHDYCHHCDEHFNSSGDVESHFRRAHGYCSSCRRFFEDDAGLQEHYSQSEQHHYCAPCNQHFTSASNLNAHLNSSVHQPKDVKCPFDCGATFVSNSALLLHLENGGCPSGVDRDLVNQYVRQQDTKNVITVPAHMVTGGSDSSQDIAIKRSWNGSGYECSLCHSTHRSLDALKRHLASPRHQDQIYICRGTSCGVRFTTFSGLAQHIESGKCDAACMRAVQKVMNRLLRQMGQIITM